MTANILSRLPVLVAAACLFPGSIAMAQQEEEPFSWTPIPHRLPSTTQQIGNEIWLTVQPLSLYYFGWEHSPDLQTHWSMANMALGDAPATFHFLPDPLVPRDFYRVRAINLWSPGDADGDCIDDVWELRNGLDPVLAADAQLPSAADPLLTNLEYYRRRFGLLEADGRVPVKEYFSDELSVSNWPGAVSSEISVYRFAPTNDALLEALSGEVSVFRSNDVALTQMEALSTEVSVFKATDATLTSLEAISAEVSVFKAAPFTLPGVEAISDEVSVFRQAPFILPAVEAISEEVSVFRAAPFTLPPVEAISEEVSVFRFSALPAWQNEAISPEVSVLK